MEERFKAWQRTWKGRRGNAYAGKFPGWGRISSGWMFSGPEAEWREAAGRGSIDMRHRRE